MMVGMGGRSETRHRRALKREASGYHGGLRQRAVLVGSTEWASQFDAAKSLDVSMVRVGLLIAGGRLEPAHDPLGRAGVTTSSLEREHTRRAGRGLVRRLRIAVGDVVLALLRGA
jgi:hypothetical protein